MYVNVRWDNDTETLAVFGNRLGEPFATEGRAKREATVARDHDPDGREFLTLMIKPAEKMLAPSP